MKSWHHVFTSLSRLAAAVVAVSLGLIFGAGTAAAQVGDPNNPLPQPITPVQPDKPDGVAEKAKDGPDQLPSVPTLPAETSKNKRFELFNIDGYFRFRTDWFKNFHLGFDSDAEGGAPFPESLACLGNDVSCDKTLKMANMQLRLEPQITLREGTTVYTQIDLLDNVVAGSTPNGAFQDGTPSPGHVPIRGLSDTGVAPERGRNNNSDALHVKRAWAEVETDLGQFAFGRMPWHWGMGIFANAGGRDPFSGTYDLNSDYGDTVDRLSFRTNVPGTDLSGSIATDWLSTTPSSSQNPIGDNRYFGQPWDLEDSDDVSQWVLSLARFDAPQLFRDRVNKGDLALNYGVQFVYRTQELESDATNPNQLIPTLVARDLTAYIPDLWFKLGSGKLTIEAELVAVLGSIGQAGGLGAAEAGESLDLRQVGGVARLNYLALADKMDLGFEIGFASGDQYDNEQPGEINVRNAQLFPNVPAANDTSINRFIFDFDYDVDMILFRQLMGAVSNATYLRPSMTYAITDKIDMSARLILSMANVQVSTPGNSLFYGLEANGSLGYHHNGFFAGATYGIYFPFGAMDHPQDGDNGPGFGFGDTPQGAGTAHTFQSRLVLQF